MYDGAVVYVITRPADADVEQLRKVEERVQKCLDDRSGREPLLDEAFADCNGCEDLFDLGRARARVAVQAAIMFRQTNRFGVCLSGMRAEASAERLRDHYRELEAENNHFHLLQKMNGTFSADIVKTMHRQSLQSMAQNTAAYEYGCFGCLGETYPGLKMVSKEEVSLFAAENVRDAREIARDTSATPPRCAWPRLPARRPEGRAAAAARLASRHHLGH
eukprot:5879621-Prymnesium_polylepis.1